jgi:arylsulfatase A-like enzyme
LITGRYQQRFGFEFNAGPIKRAETLPEMGLPLSEKTLADFARAQGYATGMVGKWHLGLPPKFHPMQRGFNEYFGFRFGENYYIDPTAEDAVSLDWRSKETQWKGRPASDPMMRDQTPVDEKAYLTEAFAREAVSFIDRHQKDPFFLYVPFNAVHKPLQATQKYFDRFPKIKEPNRRIYAAMTSALDDAVGQILAKVRDTGLQNDTLIFFLSDNGGALGVAPADNSPLRAGKMSYFEGGIRVPYIVSWPSRLPAGKKYDSPVSSLDILPTILTAIGAEVPKEADGVDLIPYLSGKKDSTPHDHLCWRAGSNEAIRKGDWKLLRAKGKGVFLYDLSTDIGETKNLADSRSDVVTQLQSLLDAWERELAAPMWPAQNGPSITVDGVTLDFAF